MTQHGSDGLERRVRDDVQQAVAPLGLLVDDLRITRAGKRRLVRIAVDDDLAGLAPGDETTPVPPVELDTVAEATRSIDNALDASDVLGSAPYVLEVTSPGTSRPLTEPRHFRRNVGRLVTLALTDGSTLAGRIVAAGAEGLRLADPKAAGNDEAVRFVDYAALHRAQVRVEFTHAVDELDEADLPDGPDETEEN